MTPVLICTCGHPKTQHKAERHGCRNCDLGCSRFEHDEAAATAERTRVLEAVATVCEDQADQARGELGQPSTSARLDELRRGRDEAVERALQLAAELKATKDLHRIEWGRERDACVKLRQERDQARDELAAVGRERDGVREELARQAADAEDLRAELVKMVRSRDHHRRRGDQAHAQLAAAQQEATARDEGEAYDDERMAAAGREIAALRAQLAAGVLVDRAAQHCPPCRWTGGRHEHHPHPTVPVRVVIHRTEGAPA